jgi:phosphate transport system protein
MTPRKVFAAELETLRQDVIQMGSEIENLIEQTIEVFTTNNQELAHAVIKKDDLIDEMEMAIEKKCIMLIAQQQPMAGDLRLIFSILKIVTDMERIGDHCEDICNYYLKVQNKVWDTDKGYQRHIERMAKNVRKMLKDTMDSFTQKNIEQIESICKYDDAIDSEFGKIWVELTEEMGQRKEFIQDGADYIMIIKYLERIADHTTNIAEWLYYHITGNHI